MKLESTEKFIERLACDLYPITVIKLLLNRRRILSYFQRAADPTFEIRGTKYTLSPDDCEICKSKKDEGILCRQHTSIDRVLNAKKVTYDLDLNCFLYKNEIFRLVGNKLVIVYCPHPKLISGEITDSKVRKVSPITIENIDHEFSFEEVREFISSELTEKYMKCWFNNEFSLVTIPNDRNSSNWCLFPNK